MKKPLSIFLALVVCACRFASLPFSTPTVAVQFTPTASATVNVSTQFSPSPTAQEIQTSVGYTRNCLQIEKHSPEDVVLQGHIVTKANDAYNLVSFPPDEHFSSELSNIYGDAILNISPDGQWLVYELADAPDDFVTIKGFSFLTDTQWTTKVPDIPRDKSYWTYWLDDEKMLFYFYLENPIVVNLFNGQTQQLESVS